MPSAPFMTSSTDTQSETGSARFHKGLRKRSPMSTPETRRQLKESAQGWIQLETNTRVAAQFTVDQHSIRVFPTATGDDLPASCPTEIMLTSVNGVDAIGEPVDAIETVEVSVDNDEQFMFGWSLDFCKEVITALMSTATTAPESGATETAASSTAPTHHTSTSGQAAMPPVTSSQTPEDAPRRSASVLDIEEVNYLGGYPNFSRKKKKVSAVFSPESIVVKLSEADEIKVDWVDVQTIEIQNSDEARFRMNLKIHRNSSAVIIDCGNDVALRLEARDCPTIALRNAISELLAHQPVVVV